MKRKNKEREEKRRQKREKREAPADKAPAAAKGTPKPPRATSAKKKAGERELRARSPKKRVRKNPRSAGRAKQSVPRSNDLPPEFEVDEAATPEFEEEAPELGIGSRMIAPDFEWSAEEDAPPQSARPQGDVAEQIRALEARLDGLIRGARAQPEPAQAPPAKVEVAEGAPPSEPLSQTPYFEKHWGREALRSRAEEVDDFGLDPAVERRIRPLAEFLFRRYFRARVDGISNVPRDGRCLLVANHSGTLPLDGLMLRTALRLEHPAMRELRWLAEDFLFYLPFAGVFMNRVGAVRACQENAERLLEKELAVAAFPEGVQGIKKLFRDRYQLQRFGRGGYVRLALRMQAPIVPCAIVGAEETNPLLYRVEYLANLVGLPYLPVTPTFPLLGPLGLLPAPSRWRIRFGEPVSLEGHGPQSADDHVLVGRLSERVRTTIQGMLETDLRERRSVWFG